jgi:hypothetical protein
MNKIHKTLILFAIILLLSCQNKQAPLPIEKEKLIKILVDVQLAEALIQDDRQEIKDSLAPVYYKQIFEKHGVNRSLFDTAMSFLGYNPPLMDEIYTQVIKEIEKKETQLK